MSWLFTSGGQSIAASTSASVLPKSIQGWFPLGLTGLISLQSKGLSRVFSNTTVQKQQLCLLYHPAVTSVHDYCKDHSLNYMDLCLEMWCVWFLTHCLGLSSFSVKKQLSPNFKLAVAIHSDFRHHKKEICHCFHLFLFHLPWSDGTRCHDLIFFKYSFLSWLFHSPPSSSSRGSSVPLCFLL